MSQRKNARGIRAVGRVVVPVTDQDRSLDFYTRVLGFEVRTDAVADESGRWLEVAPHGGRVFVHLLSIVGFTVVVSAIYLTVVLGLGHTPDTSADRDVLGLSMLAAAIATMATPAFTRHPATAS